MKVDPLMLGELPPEDTEDAPGPPQLCGGITPVPDSPCGSEGRESPPPQPASPSHLTGANDEGDTFVLCSRHQRRRHIMYTIESDAGVYVCHPNSTCKEPRHRDEGKPAKAQPFYCRDCAIVLNSWRQAQVHTTGSRHMARVRELRMLHKRRGLPYQPSEIAPYRASEEKQREDKAKPGWVPAVDTTQAAADQQTVRVEEPAAAVHHAEPMPLTATVPPAGAVGARVMQAAPATAAVPAGTHQGMMVMMTVPTTMMFTMMPGQQPGCMQPVQVTAASLPQHMFRPPAAPVAAVQALPHQGVVPCVGAMNGMRMT
eukprot:TRINITY_DN4760_c0_g2_i1.p2 TRINITY_DN4760_c0_g2~~TRINITY_DN4760_c0_g2_i1.p2  ORF type:complete len:350 (+),score=84.67 TRINITY_DN4760_c0_g2_i1:111-1052(+)